MTYFTYFKNILSINKWMEAAIMIVKLVFKQIWKCKVFFTSRDVLSILILKQIPIFPENCVMLINKISVNRRTTCTFEFRISKKTKMIEL